VSKDWVRKEYCERLQPKPLPSLRVKPSRKQAGRGVGNPVRALRSTRSRAVQSTRLIPHAHMLSTILRSRSQAPLRALHTARVLRNQKWPQLTNILAGEVPPPVQVKSISTAGLLLQDGRLLPSACIFLEGEVLLWDVPATLWKGWDESRFEVFDAVVPKPGACPWLAPGFWGNLTTIRQKSC
jgi:hypothetical protein